MTQFTHRRTLSLTLAVAQVCVTMAVSAQPAGEMSGRLLSSQCAQCHGYNGYSVGGIESLAGEVNEIVEELSESHWETGGGMMDYQARGYTPEQAQMIQSYMSATNLARNPDAYAPLSNSAAGGSSGNGDDDDSSAGRDYDDEDSSSRDDDDRSGRDDDDASERDDDSSDRDRDRGSDADDDRSDDGSDDDRANDGDDRSRDGGDGSDDRDSADTEEDDSRAWINSSGRTKNGSASSSSKKASASANNDNGDSWYERLMRWLQDR